MKEVRKCQQQQGKAIALQAHAIWGWIAALMAELALTARLAAMFSSMGWACIAYLIQDLQIARMAARFKACQHLAQSWLMAWA